MVSLFFIFFSLSSYASTPFDFAHDRLCFKNADPQMAEAAPWPWGPLAVKTGACQGIAGVTAAFSLNALFDESLGEGDVRGIIKKLVQAHRKGKKLDSKVIVPGYKNLYDLCLAHKEEFLRESVLYNRDIAIIEIAKHYPKLMSSKGKISTAKDLLHVKNTLNAFEQKLSQGNLPLMLYFQHVVMVYGLHKKDQETILTVYDSNKLVPREMVFHLDETDKLIWDVTPGK
ncbi:MAG: hypothetical protein ACOYL6_08830 [Bacteriovoracaceae bacterium]